MTLLEEAARRGGDALDALLDSLASGETGLSELTDRPRLLARLDERARRSPWLVTPEPPSAFDRLVGRFRRAPTEPAPAPLTPIMAALAGLDRDGLDAEVAAAADDPAPLVRAYARSRIADPVAHYRAAVTDKPTPATVAGLGEVGGYADEAVLTPLLGHSDAPVRAAAVKALSAIDCVPVDAVVPLLQDPSPPVVREASAALRPYRRRLPAELLWRLLTGERAEVRRGAYRILSNWEPAERLRAALILAADTDPGLARRGRDDAYRLRPFLPAQRDDLVALAAGIGPQLADLVRRAPVG